MPDRLDPASWDVHTLAGLREAREAERAARRGTPPPALSELEKLRALPPAEQRRRAREDWADTARILAGRRDPAQPLTEAEKRDLRGTLKAHPELAGHPDRWQEIQAAMKRKQETPR